MHEQPAFEPSSELEVPRLTRLSTGAEGRLDFPCPYETCDGSGFELDEEANTARPCRCRERRVALARSRSLAHSIPRRFRDVAFDRHPVTSLDRTITAPVRSFCAQIEARLDRGDGLGFWGPPGTYKTTLAMLVSKRALAAGRAVAIYTLPELLTEIRTTYDDNSDRSYQRLMQQLAGVDLLHVDDMAVARTNDWTLEQLYSVINTRYEDQRSIVYTMDVPAPDDLGKHVGERTFSRLVEMCGDPIPLMGEDQRKLNAPQH